MKPITLKFLKCSSFLTVCKKKYLETSSFLRKQILRRSTSEDELKEN